MRLNRISTLLLMVFCMLSIGNAQGARVTGLYTAQLLVAEQSAQVPTGLIATAMRQVIVKVSGRKDLASHPLIRTALESPNPYVQKFSYQATTIPINTDDGRQVLAQRLSLEFSPMLVDQLLIDAGIQPLGATRPSVLLWIAEERGGRREYLGRDEDPVFAAMLARARERALPIFRPLMDLEDEQALPVSDAWGFFADSIRRASSRYQADAILVGRLYTDPGGGWRSQWQLIWPQEVIGFSGRGQALDEQLASAIEFAADRLFADFVRPSSGFDQGGVKMQVDGVADLDDYFQITNYLLELPAISAVSVQSLQADQLTLRLQVDGSVKQVQGAIGLNQRFIPQFGFAMEGAQQGQSELLSYRWRE